MNITITEYKVLKEKAEKWDALEAEYDEAVAVDDDGEDLNPDTDLCTLGEILQKHMMIYG